MQYQYSRWQMVAVKLLQYLSYLLFVLNRALIMQPAKISTSLHNQAVWSQLWLFTDTFYIIWWVFEWTEKTLITLQDQSSEQTVYQSCQM